MNLRVKRTLAALLVLTSGAWAEDIHISVAPHYLRQHDQAILVITHRFDSASSKPVELLFEKLPESLSADQIISQNAKSIETNPDSLAVRVYRLTLNADQAEITKELFSRLPADHNFRDMKLERAKQ